MEIESAETEIRNEAVHETAERMKGAPDAGYAEVVAESARRRLREPMIAASIATLVPTLRDLVAAGGSSPDGRVRVASDGSPTKAVFADASGDDAFLVRIKETRTSGPQPKPMLEFSLAMIARSLGDYDTPVAHGGLWRDDDRDGTVAHGRILFNQIPEWFRFSEMAMASLSLRDPGSLHLMETWRPNAVLALTSSDGGLAGHRCRALVEQQERTIVRERIPFLVPLLVEAANGLSKAGLTWGSRYVAYNDSDIRCCSVQIPGSVAVFHENIDLISDYASFVAVVGMDEAGAAKTFACHALDRRLDSPARFVGALVDGRDVPPPIVAMNLVSGELLMKDAIDVTGTGDYMRCALEGDLQMLRARDAGRFGIGYEERIDFDDLEPRAYEDYQDEEEPGGNEPSQP